MSRATSELTLATCQAGNTFPISRALAAYLSEQLGRPVRFLDGPDWRAAYAGIAAGRIDVGWICGRPYVELLTAGTPLSLLAAPVMAGARYDGRPVYFSDVVVRRDSRFHSFADLRGASWAYNEPGSHSGYHVTRYHLAQLGETGRYFGRIVGSGSHARSLELVLSGEIDASAIDSTVLEWAIAHDPTLAQRLRVIDTLGPSPSPPLVVAGERGRALREPLRVALLALPETAGGQALLALGGLARFAAVEDGDYDPIRTMAKVAQLAPDFV
jgi:phosphonate transport system substrate-binding protein